MHQKGNKNAIDAATPIDLSIPLITWNHSVVWNIPANSTVRGWRRLGFGVEGRNTWRRKAYGRPDQPFGSHKYKFKVYALDILLELDA
jgi:phosphatidylethanolamine-binding protein (PEBP) family uncharacterized protein